MSGGVDSSVSALLLKQQGYNVTGVFIKTWQPDYIECTWKNDRLDAIRIAAQLDISFITLDLEKEYKEGVVDYMINEYMAGYTPNPDIMCNREIKFGAFYKYVKSIDANAIIATGHYANVMNGNPSLGKVTKAEGRNLNLALSKAIDQSKDQVYFLSQIDRNILSDIIFPLGEMMKSEVRQIAQDNNLYVANKKDSQGICMLGNISMKDFLKKEIEMRNKNGIFKDAQSDLMYYTIGERIDFNINEIKNLSFNVLIIDEKNKNYNKTDVAISDKNQKSYYVVAKNIKDNTLFISTNKIENNKSKVYKIESWNYTSNIELKENNIYEGQSRYHGPIHNFKILDYEMTLGMNDIMNLDDDNKEISFKYILNIEVQDENTLMVPGQTIVFYDGNIMIGGGIIE